MCDLKEVIEMVPEDGEPEFEREFGPILKYKKNV